MKKIALPILCLTLSFFMAWSQPGNKKEIDKAFSVYKNNNLTEKIFVHTDKNIYLAGETMWFNIFCLHGSTHQLFDISKVAYVELLDKDNNAVLQTKIELKNGLGTGSFLLPTGMNAGNYTFRAYSNWMKNFEPAYYYHQSVKIINPFKGLGPALNKDSTGLAIRFFPEGGNLVKNLPANVGFKATLNGEGTDCYGFIIGSKNDTVAKFKPSKFGLGHFSFTPKNTEGYRVLIRRGKTSYKTILPVIIDQGFVLRIEEQDEKSLKVLINANVSSDSVYLFAHTRQSINISTGIFLNNGKGEYVVDKSTLAEGITHFTLFDPQRRPVCERLYFKPVAKRLRIEAMPDKQVYGKREKVQLDIHANTSTAGTALSVAVFLQDSLATPSENDILNYTWLTSDLNGKVENAGYYLSHPEDKDAMNDLMLTHGWRRFKWSQIMGANGNEKKYYPEYNGHIIKAMAIDTISKAPAQNVESYLSSPGKIIRTYNAKTDANGFAYFEMKNFYGSREVVLQSFVQSGKVYHYQIESPFSSSFADRRATDFQVSPLLAPAILAASVRMQAQNIYYKNNNKWYPQVSDSIPFYTKPDEKYKLDDYTRFKTMEDVLREYVAGVVVRKRKDKFHFMVTNTRDKAVFQDDPLVLLDGVPIFNIDSIMNFNPAIIRNLDVVTHRYFLGQGVYSGVVSFGTYQGDLGGFPIDPAWTVLDYEGLQLQREFYSPDYSKVDNTAARLPDFRSLLYWRPVSWQTGNDEKIIFYTGDQQGKYAVVVQGIDNEGYMGSKTTFMEVKK